MSAPSPQSRRTSRRTARRAARKQGRRRLAPLELLPVRQPATTDREQAAERVIDRMIMLLAGEPCALPPGVALDKLVLFIDETCVRQMYRADARRVGSREARHLLDFVERHPAPPNEIAAIFEIGKLAQVRWLRVGHMTKGGHS